MATMKRKLFGYGLVVVIVAAVFWMVTTIYAATFDATKSYGQLLDWTMLDQRDDTHTEYVDSAVLDSGESADSALRIVLHIDMAHQDANAAGDPAYAIIFVKSGATDECWHKFLTLEATGGTANAGDIDREAAAAQNEIGLASTTNFETGGDTYFVLDVGDITASCLVTNTGDYDNDDDIVVMDNLVNTYDDADYLYDIVDQWSIRIPEAFQIVKVLFTNTDADATYAVRVHYNVLTDVDDS